MHQCGLPKEMAIELFPQPSLSHRLDPAEHRNNIKAAKKLDSAPHDDEVMQVLQE